MINFLDTILNSFLYTGFMGFLAIFSLITVPFLFIEILKTKKIFLKIFISFFLLIFTFIAYEGIPYFYTLKAKLSNNEEVASNNFEKAINTAIFPIHKGLLYLDYGSFMTIPYKNSEKTYKCYQKAYTYLKKYEPKTQWIIAGLFYKSYEDYSKAEEIFNSLEIYSALSEIYILKNDYNKALEYINKAINKKNSAWHYIQRAVIYRNLNKENLAKENYNIAIKMFKRQNFDTKKMEYFYNNYKTCYLEQHNTSRKKLGIK